LVKLQASRVELCRIIGALNTTPTAVLEVLIGPAVHLLFEAEAFVGVHRLTCSELGFIKHQAMKMYGGVEIWLHHSYLGTRWGGQLHAPAVLPPGSVGYAGWTSEPVWM
jgi:hypothetical protein